MASILFLRTRNFFHDSLALAVTEIGLVVLAAGIVAGTIAGRSARPLVDLGRPRHHRAGLLAPLRALPDAAQRHRRAHAPRRFRRRSFHLRHFRRACHRRAVHWWLAKNGVGTTLAPTWFIAPLLILAAALAWSRFRQEQRRRAQDAERRTMQEI